MIYFINYTPQVASLKNDKKGRTVRTGLDDPRPINVSGAYDNTLYFQLQNEANQTLNVIDLTLTAVITNFNGVKLLEKDLKVHSSDSNVAVLSLNAFESKSLQTGFLNMIITVGSSNGNKEVAQTFRGNPRFVLNVIRHST